MAGQEQTINLNVSDLEKLITEAVTEVIQGEQKEIVKLKKARAEALKAKKKAHQDEMKVEYEKYTAPIREYYETHTNEGVAGAEQMGANIAKPIVHNKVMGTVRGFIRGLKQS